MDMKLISATCSRLVLQPYFIMVRRCRLGLRDVLWDFYYSEEQKIESISDTRWWKNFNLKKGIGIESEKYANKLEIKKVWKQVKDGAQWS